MSRSIVLLVEDDPNEVDLAVHAFRKHGIADEVDGVAVARDGEEALDYLFCRGKHAGGDPSDVPAFVLLDIKLPKLTGMEVLECIRADERTKLLPVIVYSSSAQEEDVRAAYERGANSYVTKPTDFERFSEAIRSLGSYWLELNELPPPP